jgi:hypothetical protein
MGLFPEAGFLFATALNTGPALRGKEKWPEQGDLRAESEVDV